MLSRWLRAKLECLIEWVLGQARQDPDISFADYQDLVSQANDFKGRLARPSNPGSANG